MDGEGLDIGYLIFILDDIIFGNYLVDGEGLQHSMPCHHCLVLLMIVTLKIGHITVTMILTRIVRKKKMDVRLNSPGALSATFCSGTPGVIFSILGN